MSDNLKLNLNGTEVEITMDDNGRYSLNDLHRASGSSPTKKPVEFLRHRGKDIEKVNVSNGGKSHHSQQDFDSFVVIAGKGRYATTFAPLNVVYRYASFISKEFENAVYAAFTALAKGEPQQASEIMESVTVSPELVAKADSLRKKMNQMIKDKFPDVKPYIYGNFNKLVSKGATGFTPKELTGGGKSSVSYMTDKAHEPALSAQIATYETVIRMLAIPSIGYHEVAVVLGVETSKNKDMMKMISR